MKNNVSCLLSCELGIADNNVQQPIKQHVEKTCLHQKQGKKKDKNESLYFGKNVQGGKSNSTEAMVRTLLTLTKP